MADTPRTAESAGTARAADVSFVIVNWNAAGEVAACLDSLAAHPPALPYEVVVIDNASSDGSVATIRNRYPWVQLVVNDSNRGLAAGNNQGLRLARGQWIIVSNPDVQFRRGSVDALVDLLQRHARAAFAFARLERPDGSLQTSAGSLPRLSDALLGRQILRARADGEPSGFWWDGWPHDTERRIGHGLEACYAARRAAIDEIGLQDERYWLDWEGIDWCSRATDLGWEVWFCPAAPIVHTGGASIRKAELRWVLASHRGMYVYFRSRSHRLFRPLLASLFAVRAAAKAIAVVVGARMYDRAHPGST